MKKVFSLLEAGHKSINETPREKKLKQQLIALLKDDGKGHHHSKYAAVLDRYKVNIVPLKDDPDFTAAISFDDGIVYVGEGFLVDPSYFYQLNVILRHELAHNLMMHQIRMMHKIMEKPWSHIKYSRSLHELQNIIMDYEISHTRYNEEDKKTIRNMYLNGKLIGGLLTEDDRPDWVGLSVEDMYDKLNDEIEQEQNYAKSLIINGRQVSKDKDTIAARAIPMQKMYTDINSPCQLKAKLDKFIGSNLFNALPEPIQNIIKDLYNSIVLSNVAYSDQDIKKMQQDIAATTVAKSLDLVSPVTGEVITELYTPEEKQWAQEILKNILMFVDEYTEWYQKVIGVLADSKYTNDDIKQVMDALKETN